MKNNFHVKRYAAIMLLGVLFNLGFYQIAHIFHLPMWIDNIGTAYAALVLEPAAGLLVAFATNFYEATFVYDSSSLIYYAVSASCALTIGILMRKQGHICWKRIFLALGAYFLISSCLATIFTLWITAGIPDSGWERYFFDIARSNQLPIPLSCLFGVGVLKLMDSLVMLFVLPILYKLTPKRFINEVQEIIISFKNK